MLKTTCLICNSVDTERINTYKHHCIICNDCNCVSHVKKDKYLLDYLLPKKLMKKILPDKAYFRLFSVDEFVASEFYDVYAEEALNLNYWRKSEFQQILDELGKGRVDYKGKKILDISGGPGLLISQFKTDALEVSVTEFSQISVDAMGSIFGVDARKFDYNADKIDDVFYDKKFDIILVRSSIIFCENLNDFVRRLSRLLNPDGIVLIESILPTYGEVFWWQQMEHVVAK